MTAPDRRLASSFTLQAGVWALVLFTAPRDPARLIREAPGRVLLAACAAWGLAEARGVKFAARRGPVAVPRAARWLDRAVLAGMMATLVLSLRLGFPLVPSRASLVAGALLLAAGIALRLRALRALGAQFTAALAPEQLVRAGPYRWMRHPAYVGLSLIAFGLAALAESPAGGVAAAAGVALPLAWRGRLETRASRSEGNPTPASPAPQ